MSNLTNVSSPRQTVLTKEQQCELPVKENHLFLLVLLILVLIITFLGNLLVLLAVIFFRRLRSITNYFIFSLAVSDILIALLSLPFRIDQNIHNGQWCLSLTACQIWILVDSMCTFASMWNLAVISIDRFIAIKLPFRYHSLITIRVCVAMIATVWIYSIFLAGMSFTNWTRPGEQSFSIHGECSNVDAIYYTVVISLSFFSPLLVILVMYGMVFEVALNHTRAMAALQVNAARGGRRSSVNLIREVKAAKTLAIVVGCFIVCWLPFNIIFFILLWQPKLIFDLSQQTRVVLAMTFIYVLPALNSTMNPIIYALFNRDFRSAFVTLSRRVTGKRMGAVGFGGSLDPPSAISNIRDESMMHRSSSVVQFKDYRESPLPTNRQYLDPRSYNNQAYSKQTPFYSQNNNDTHSMNTTLHDDKNSKMNDTIAPEQHGHVTDDITQPENGILHDNMNVMEKDEAHCTNMAAMSVRLPPLEKSPVFFNEKDCLPAAKPSILPPIERVGLVRDTTRVSKDDSQPQEGIEENSSLADSKGYDTAL